MLELFQAKSQGLVLPVLGLAAAPFFHLQSWNGVVVSKMNHLGLIR